jgi:hypothetical protein
MGNKGVKHFVILRDDDTNAFTPPECLEQLYRPFLDRGLPVNLAAIPSVRRSAKTPEGKPEGFLFGHHGGNDVAPLTDNLDLINYLQQEPLFKIVQHGCNHDPFEFDLQDPNEVNRKIRVGAEQLAAAGFPASETFVAPHDKISREAYPELKRRFRVISTGWFERNRIPRAWLPRYCCRKLLRRPHWRVGRTLLLSHPGCILSRNRPYEGMLDQIKRAVTRGRLTVLVTHWWEYFPNQKADPDFIGVLHAAANYLASSPSIRVLSFADLPTRNIPLN